MCTGLRNIKEMCGFGQDKEDLDWFAAESCLFVHASIGPVRGHCAVYKTAALYVCAVRYLVDVSMNADWPKMVVFTLLHHKRLAIIGMVRNVIVFVTD
jgi:hypothetical protein